VTEGDTLTCTLTCMLRYATLLNCVVNAVSIVHDHLVVIFVARLPKVETNL
jgi:hypothetical protein